MIGLEFTFRFFEKAYGLKRTQDMLRRLANGNTYVKVGLLGAISRGKAGAGLDVVKLGAIHEYGTANRRIPARHWISGSFKKYRPEYVKLLSQLLKQVYTAKLQPEQALQAVGLRMVQGVNTYVRKGHVYPKLAQSTMARRLQKAKLSGRLSAAHGGRVRSRKTGRYASSRGKVTPLIDTGRMLNAVTYEVVTQGKPPQ